MSKRRYPYTDYRLCYSLKYKEPESHKFVDPWEPYIQVAFKCGFVALLIGLVFVLPEPILHIYGIILSYLIGPLIGVWLAFKCYE